MVQQQSGNTGEAVPEVPGVGVRNLRCLDAAGTDGLKRGELSVSVGDQVIYGKYGGTEIEINGEEVKILRESDILAKVTG